MNIALDMMGGDYAPLEAVKGVKEFLQENSAIQLTLIGDSTLVNPLLEAYHIPSGSIQVVHTTEVIGMNEHPTRALKEKTNSSIAVGFGLLAAGKVDAFISAGNTGAMLVGSLFSIKPIEGVIRPTISTVIPKEDGSTGLLLDVGLNADCKPDQLNQFAIMGSVYARLMLGIAEPTVGLLNVGEEEGKGNNLAQATYPLLKANSAIKFVGNIEGRDVFSEKATVMVCDGFTGNIILKLAESFYPLTRKKGINDPYLDRFNFETYGGTPVLGITKPAIIGHGISQATAFKNMIAIAQKMLETKVLEKMQESIKTAAPNH